jgi:hypothetical protein
MYVPGAGVEPARLAASVFETDASTNSAIRAENFAFDLKRCESIQTFFYTQQILLF